MSRYRVVTLARLRRAAEQYRGGEPNPMLRCAKCGALSSAHPGDYFLVSEDHVFTCCGEPVALVTKRTVYREVTA